MSKKGHKNCLWHKRGDCTEKVIDRLTTFMPEDWGKTKPGKALESDYSIQYCTFCLMAKIAEQMEEMNKTLTKINKRMQPQV